MKKNVQANFLMGLIFRTSWRVAPTKKKIPYGDLDFWNFVYKHFGINGRVHVSNFTSFQTFFYKGISFVKLTLPHFFEQN